MSKDKNTPTVARRRFLQAGATAAVGLSQRSRRSDTTAARARACSWKYMLRPTASCARTAPISSALNAEPRYPAPE